MRKKSHFEQLLDEYIRKDITREEYNSRTDEAREKDRQEELRSKSEFIDDGC